VLPLQPDVVHAAFGEVGVDFESSDAGVFGLATGVNTLLLSKILERYLE
jgi:hypothetical protein